MNAALIDWQCACLGIAGKRENALKAFSLHWMATC
jgi:hypothetical protein